jgi:hypothetical protein
MPVVDHNMRPAAISGRFTFARPTINDAQRCHQRLPGDLRRRSLTGLTTH